MSRVKAAAANSNLHIQRCHLDLAAVQTISPTNSRDQRKISDQLSLEYNDLGNQFQYGHALTD